MTLLLLHITFFLEHIAEYFKKCDATLSETSDEFVESVHHDLKRMEENHNVCIRTRKLFGSPTHKRKILESICTYNYKNLGFYMSDAEVTQATRTTPPGPDMNTVNWQSCFHDYL